MVVTSSVGICSTEPPKSQHLGRKRSLLLQMRQPESMQIAQLAEMPSSAKSDRDVTGGLSTSCVSCGQQVENPGSLTCLFTMDMKL